MKFLAGQMFLMTLFVVAPLRNATAPYSFSTRIQAPRLSVVCSSTLPRTAWRGRSACCSRRGSYREPPGRRTQVETRQRDPNRRSTYLGREDGDSSERSRRSVVVWTDATLWRRLVVQSSSAALIIPMSNIWLPNAPNARRYWSRLDTATNTVVSHRFRSPVLPSR